MKFDKHILYKEIMKFDKHILYKEYTSFELISLYGDGFFKRGTPRPSKPCVTDYNGFDDDHKAVYEKMSSLLATLNGSKVPAWAFGSRVSGRWMTKEEDPKGKGSDWDIFVNTGTIVPDKVVLSEFGLGNIRVDFRFGKIIPPNGVKLL